MSGSHDQKSAAEASAKARTIRVNNLKAMYSELTAQGDTNPDAQATSKPSPSR